MSHAWHFLGSTPLQQLGKLTLREDAWRLPTGDERRYPVLHVGPTVGVVPFVEPGHVLLIRQFRHLTRADSWEIPGGGGQPGEEPAEAAQRELREEGGYRAGRLTFLTRFQPSSAASSPSPKRCRWPSARASPNRSPSSPSSPQPSS